MIRIICDKCGSDCDRVGYEVRVAPIHNPTPLYALDVGDLQITDEHKGFRFILCEKCYRKMGFPNYYKVIESKNLIFRDKEDAEKVVWRNEQESKV